MKKPFAAATVAAQALGRIDDETRAIILPIHPATTYLRDPDNGYSSGRVYSRADNPSYDQPEALLTHLEGGAATLLFASGMAAATSAFMALEPGDRALAPNVMYWGLRKWLAGAAARFGVTVDFVDMADLDALRAAANAGPTKLIWVETPANPLWTITDLAAAADIAHGVGARLAVDSTCASPVLTRPLEHGADIVMHSATKYLNGHSDVIAGSLTVAATDEYWERLQHIRGEGGAVLGPFEAYLLTRGMRTLYLRVNAACRNAQAIAERFATDPRVRAVLYPGLPNSVDHTIARRQMTGGFGGMLSIRVAAGEQAAIAVAARVQLWKRATSLGGVESLVEHRASVEGPGSPVPGDLLRLSVGVEDVGDLIADLDYALG